MIKKIIIGIVALLCSLPHPEKAKPGIPDNTIINLYDAFGEIKPGVKKDFGFSCIIKYKGKTILFDAGGNADFFKKNVEALGIDLKKIDFAVASHAHFDHINGFDYLLEVNPRVKIYFPYDVFWGAPLPFNLTGKDSMAAYSLDRKMQYFDGKFENFVFNPSGRFWKANVEFVSKNKEIEPGIRLVSTSSPYMGYFMKYPALESGKNLTQKQGKDGDRHVELPELSLSLDGKNGQILIVGCSHSTVEKIIVETVKFSGKNIDLVYGGYHLLPYDEKVLGPLAKRLKNNHKVKRIAPTHCTGHLAFKILKQEFGKNYIFAGLGESLKF